MKKVGVGFAIPVGESAAPSGMELVTGDTNIVNAALVLIALALALIPCAGMLQPRMPVIFEWEL